MTMEGRYRPSKVIGYWMSEKKRQKLNWSEFGCVCKKNGYDLVKLDLARPLEDQGPFCLILHKLTDIIALAGQGDARAQEMIDRVEDYFRSHPEVAVLDPLDNVRKLLDRYLSYSVIHHSGLEEIDVFTPAFVELVSDDYNENLTRLKLAGVSFPFVCKPSVAHGSSHAHKMSVIFNERGVKDCKPPCVAQSFINHNAVLYKIYLVGEQHFVVERPSLKNFYPSDRETIFFDSHDVSKADSTSSLSILDPCDHNITVATPDPARFQQIVSTLRRALGMSLLGIDVVIENGSGHYAIIDINAYPGYDGFPNFFESLMTCIKNTINEHLSSLTAYNTSSSQSSSSSSPLKSTVDDPTFVKPVSQSGNDQDDSGFDTGDSSDEKKKNSQRIESNLRKVTATRK
ncbi:inositol-tetrakisphosphate 1-kinase isoform X2 [Anabrus simplex]|uniref:inositol-tetrakisphosphate 1-kinase isoform X2 n=1 Tax=Anabrus simplex TaxID=316456 RepID=UPI0034DDA4B7